ncbi:MAG TPA: hypothetical protein VL769_03375 [Acidimicrobiia bacterium]|nr:hypothetical protein [Acidimicrobiia bacterium]
MIAALAVALLAVAGMVSGSTVGAAESQSAVVTAAVSVDASELMGVACPTTTLCFAVGYTLNPDTALIERWNGTSWSVVQGPNSASPVGGVLTGVACQNAWSCFAVGGGLVERWNGIRWSVVHGASLFPGWSPQLSGVSCTSTFCLAVGSQSSSGSTRTLVERWNGSTWSRIPSPSLFSASSPRLTNVSCRTTSLCFAVGEYRGSTRVMTLVERWDGTSMSVVASPNPAVGDTHLHGVACPTTTNCVAVGFSFDASVFPIGMASTWVERWNGTSWSNVTSPNPGPLVNALLGVSCTAATTCVAAGEYYPSGTYVTSVTLIESWNGVAWSVVSNPAGGFPSSFNAVRCAIANLCFAVGKGAAGGTWSTALIERWNGTSWTIVVNGNP